MPSQPAGVNTITPGFMRIQGNRTESLCQLAVTWLRRYPLAPLENEVFLAQSSGIAQWLKQSLARHREDGNDGGCGIAAAVTVMLPARLQWQSYRAVLGDLPENSPFDKPALLWRLMRLLPTLTDDVYAPLQRFLQDDTQGRKCYQLAGRLADLFDQYQVYRADWLRDWESKKDTAVPLEQRWQPALWREVVKDMPAEQRHSSRAAVHTRFLEGVKKFSTDNKPQQWPRRIVVFGISSIPKQTLEVLAAMARCTQVVFFVNNPCQKYWGDIDEDIRRDAHPLLAAWGKQGRDYMRLLDEFDGRQSYEKIFSAEQLEIDLFEMSPSGTLLSQLQNDILQLLSLRERKEKEVAIHGNDDSIVFHVAHSPQREIEIFHDQLLAAFAKDPTLKPRDIMVMVPDINVYAPHIQAVFGQIAREDKRYIPFTIADQQQRQQKPFLIAVEYLLRMEQNRFSASEIFDLLDVPAVRARFNLDESGVAVLRHWVQGAAIRWGLDAEQREAVGMPAGLAQNSWWAGLRRLLLGYAVGAHTAWQDIEPYDEIGGLDAALAGSLCDLMATLESHWRELTVPAVPAKWGKRLSQLLDDFFYINNNEDELLRTQLKQALENWQALCEQTEFNNELSLPVVREHWLNALDQPRLSQRFLTGAVNFATLLPMRAIPFKRICLLGMSHVNFPRRQPAADFDLMMQRGQYRPGDRSRREDDRYLFLEALLSAREQLYISWVGRSVKDNAVLPPSVLVAQLCDHLNAGWQEAAKQKTVEHPLQPFSRDYFSGHPPLFTYAKEWRAAHEKPVGKTAINIAINTAETIAVDAVGLKELAGFLRNPAQAYFLRVLKTDLDGTVEQIDDKEPFSFDGLEKWQLHNDLLEPIAADLRKGLAVAIDERLSEETARLQRAGHLQHAVFGELKAAALAKEVADILRRYQSVLQELSPCEAMAVQAESNGAQLSDHVDTLYLQGDRYQRLVLTPSDLGEKDKIKFYHLVKHWPAHLAVCAQGTALQTIIVHSGGTITISSVEKLAAQKQLAILLDAYKAGMQAPLPAPCKTAFAWLKENKKIDDEAAVDQFSTEKAEEAYEGGYNFTGESQESAALARCWSDFHALHKTEQFEHWVKTLYRPLYELMNDKQGEEA